MEDDLFIVDQLDQYKSICISTLARSTLREADATHLGENGYFIYEVDENPKAGGIQILAKAASVEAAFRLVDIWRGKRQAVAA